MPLFFAGILEEAEFYNLSSLANTLKEKMKAKTAAVSWGVESSCCSTVLTNLTEKDKGLLTLSLLASSLKLPPLF